jgi:predicted DNA-binding transcriptional regulator YafY
LALDGVQRTRCHEDERFTIPDDFDVDDYVQGQFGLWRHDGVPHEIVIDVDARASEVVRTRRIHPSQQIEALPDGGVRLRVWLGDLSEVATWVLGFGSLAEVVAPPELRERVQAELARALARYEG